MQLASGPYDVRYTLSCLSNAVDEARLGESTVKTDKRGSFIAQFDATRDLKGTFYSLDPIQYYYNALKEQLEESFSIKLKNNGNTFNTCFQYVE